MPASAQEEKRPGINYNLPSDTVFYVAKTDRIGFLFAARTKYHPDAKFEPRSELQGNADNFSKAIAGKLVSQRFFSWSNPEGGTYDAYESNISSDRGTFRQLYVIDGQTVYGLISGPQKSDNEADIGRFLSTLKINKR